jgi:hypothetical protein
MSGRVAPTHGHDRLSVHLYCSRGLFMFGAVVIFLMILMASLPLLAAYDP